MAKPRDACENILKCDELWLLSSADYIICLCYMSVTLNYYVLHKIAMDSFRLVFFLFALSLPKLFFRPVDSLSDFSSFFAVCLFVFLVQENCSVYGRKCFASRCIRAPKFVIWMVAVDGWYVRYSSNMLAKMSMFGFILCSFRAFASILHSMQTKSITHCNAPKIWFMCFSPSPEIEDVKLGVMPHTHTYKYMYTQPFLMCKSQWFCCHSVFPFPNIQYSMVHGISSSDPKCIKVASLFRTA